MKKTILLTLVLIYGLATDAANADFTFSAPTNLGPSINTSFNDGLPFIAPDGLSLYFTSDRPGGFGKHDLYVATRTSPEDDWGQPTNLGGKVSWPADEYFSCISTDGLELYLDSNRWGSRGARDLFVTTRSSIDAPWSLPANLGSNINSTSDDVSPNLSADGLTLLFSSNRLGGRGNYDIYICTRSSLDASWSTPVNLGEPINSAYLDVAPSLSSDGQILFFHSIRPTGFGSYDLYYSRKQAYDGLWSSPVLLPSNVNSSYVELGPSVSSDGRMLYFSEHPTYPARPEGFGKSDIWQVSIEPIVDFNGDEVVDLNDLLILMGDWNTDESLCDIGPFAWGDGVVDIEDLKVFIEYWEKENFPDLPDVHVDEDDTGSQVTLEQGQILVVTLESNPSTGYQWEVVEDPNSILEQIGEAEFKSSAEGDSPMVGAGGWEIFRFKAVSEGQMTLQMVYHRSWEPDVEPIKTFSIDVVVN